MPKFARTRVNETIDFIVGRVPNAEQNAVRGYLNHRVTTVVGGGPISGISDTMSMNDLVARGTENERKMRRSIILIETIALTPAPGTPGAKTLGAGALAGRLNPLVNSLRLMADQYGGTANLLQAKFTELRNNPVLFLQQNHLLVFGSNHDGYMNQYFVYEYSQGVGKFKIVPVRPGVATRCYTAAVINVPAILWSAVPGRTNNAGNGSFAGIVGTHLTVANTMVTTQFSGCCFCFKTHGGATYAAHIWPDDANVPGSAMPAAGMMGGGTRLAQQIAGLEVNVTAGDFAAPAPAGGIFNLYGTGYSRVGGAVGTGYPVRVGNDWMTLIGINQAGTWHFYSQHVVNGLITNALQVA